MDHLQDRFLVAVLISFLTVTATVTMPALGEESPNRLDDAKTSLVQLAAWFESLPPEERAVAARELRRWLEETYGSEVPFPFALPSEEEIASWEAEEPAQAGPEAGPNKTSGVPAVPAGAAELESTAEPTPQPSPVSVETKPALPKTPAPATRCNTLVPFDTDGDEVLTGLDRHWRHLFLWFDSDGDRKPAQGEMVSPFEFKIREISLDLRHYLAGKGKKAGRGEIETDDYIRFDTEADGFSATLLPTGDDAALAVDADALRRDPQGLDLLDASGAEVTGIQPFVRGWTITDREGLSVAIDCPG